VYEAPEPGGVGGTTVVIGEVVMWHVAEGVAGKSPSGKLVVDVQKLKPISRLGGNTYGRTNDIFDLPRPDR
jgi:flavin reductase (DIM6/NTAB) family NADH-FMN oxidoreductase RutF